MNDSDARITTIKPFFNRPCSTSTCGNLAKAGEKRCLDCIVTRARFKSTKSPIPTPALTIARPERAEVPALIQWKISPVSLPMPAPVESSWVPVDSQRYRQPIVLPATPAVEFIHIDPTPLGTGRWKPWEPVPVVKPSSPKRKRENTEGEERVTKLHKHDSKLPNHDSNPKPKAEDKVKPAKKEFTKAATTNKTNIRPTQYQSANHLYTTLSSKSKNEIYRFKGTFSVIADPNVGHVERVKQVAEALKGVIPLKRIKKSESETVPDTTTTPTGHTTRFKCKCKDALDPPEPSTEYKLSKRLPGTKSCKGVITITAEEDNSHRIFKGQKVVVMVKHGKEY